MTAPDTLLVAAEEAKRLILEGTAPAGMVVNGVLDLSFNQTLTALPENLTVRPRLILSGCMKLESLPAGLTCYELEMQNSGIKALPADIQVDFRLDLASSANLESLPEGLKVGTLILTNCRALTALPEHLNVHFLDISDCTGLETWPQHGNLSLGRLTAHNCTRLKSIPPWVNKLSRLDLRGCSGITALPEGLEISDWVDLAGTGITALPESLQDVRIRWRGVLINQEILFHPERIRARDVLAARNVELRRVMLERMGYERFIKQTDARELDRDTDKGGERRLLQIDMENDEPLVCVTYLCPSTARQYVTRVPPNMRTCRQAVAWIAGFDNPNDYRLIDES